MNQLQELLFPERGVRGAYVDLREGIDELLSWRQYPPAIYHMLGQALAASPLLASHLKFEGRINLQFQGSGPLKLLVTQIDHALVLRGMARADADADNGFEALMSGGTLALLLEPARGSQSYQAIVDIRGDTLADALQGYFAQSEQLPTFIRLAAGPDRFCGLMLQRLPASEVRNGDEHWEHLQILASTLTEQEMLAVDGETLLRRLFHEEDRRMFEPRPVNLRCRCSHGAISAMLLGLGEQELAPVLLQEGKISVTCEFCGRLYDYSEIEMRELFAAERSTAENQIRQ